MIKRYDCMKKDCAGYDPNMFYRCSDIDPILKAARALADFINEMDCHLPITVRDCGICRENATCQSARLILEKTEGLE